MSTIDQFIDRTIGLEGGYSNNPNDPGGETMWGITAHTARQHGYTGQMRAMPRPTAVAIYRAAYADAPGFTAVASIYPGVAGELFDSGVNLGPHWPSLWLQIALNAFNRQGKLYADIQEDGQVGPATLKALQGYKNIRGTEGELVLLKALNCQQGQRYLDLARQRSANEEFAYGWFRRIN